MNNVQILTDELMRMSGNNTALFMHKQLSVHQQKSLYSLFLNWLIVVEEFITSSGKLFNIFTIFFSEMNIFLCHTLH